MGEGRAERAKVFQTEEAADTACVEIDPENCLRLKVLVEDPDCLGPLPGESQATHARRTAEDLRSAAAPSDQDQALRGEATSPTASLTVEYLRQLLLRLVQATGWAERHTALGEGEPRWYCRYCHTTAHRQGVGKHWTFVCAHSEDCCIKPVLDVLEDRVPAAKRKVDR